MSHFSLINSLINPPAEPLVESPMAAEAPAPSETVTVDDTDRLAGGSRYSGIPYSLNVTYSHPKLPEPLYLTAHAKLDGEYSVEDNSFDYSYGSQNGVHRDVSDLVENLAWTGVSVPQIADNMDLFKLTPEQVDHITKVVVHYITAMEQEAIEQIVDMEKVIAILKPDDDNFNEPDDGDY